MNDKQRHYWMVVLNSWSKEIDLLELEQSIDSLKIKKIEKESEKWELLISCNDDEINTTETILRKFHKYNNKNKYVKMED